MSTEQTAPTPVRFDCPACGAVLTVPGAAAGLQGPCPKCWQEIVSPDPARGLPARLPAPSPVAAPGPPTPLPDPPEAIAPPAAPSPARWSKGRLALAITLPALIFAGVGYHFGKGHQSPILPSSPLSQYPPKSLESSPTSTPEVATPARPIEQSTEPPPPVSSEAADAEETLTAFLGAPDWQARSAFVLSADEMRPAMEKHAQEHGDGPIVATSVQLLEVSLPNHIFKVCTEAIPDGFPVPVTFTDEGPRIDWEAFTGFHDDHFKKLLEGPADRSGIFALLVKPETGSEENLHYARYRLSVPMPGREATAWLRKDSVALARLKAIFEGAGGFDKATVDRLVAETGIPLKLALTKRRTSDGRDFIEVTDVVAVGWAPPAP